MYYSVHFVSNVHEFIFHLTVAYFRLDLLFAAEFDDTGEFVLNDRKPCYWIENLSNKQNVSIKSIMVSSIWMFRRKEADRNEIFSETTIFSSNLPVWTGDVTALAQLDSTLTDLAD
ncbi:hypothetical protein CAEBREN_06435 [Caenorhabditis brenneri]|uniref:Uncharacterized protein n=1 Tax=Caenorhabditis brenneri TaxID=135651 RepID=G0P408_CAEBE|nr:hypothetical protein CAEBREN_06435 [Caenorhabditis brenneri]